MSWFPPGSSCFVIFQVDSDEKKSYVDNGENSSVQMFMKWAIDQKCKMQLHVKIC